MTEQDAYLRIIEGWLRDNRGLVHPEGSVEDLQRRIAGFVTEVEHERDSWRAKAFAAMPSAD